MSRLKLKKKQLSKRERKSPKKNDYSQKLYLSVKQAAEYTGISKYYIREYIKEGKVPYVETGVKFLINRSALEKYLKELEQ